MATSNLSHLPLPPGEMGLPWLGQPPRMLSRKHLIKQYQKHGPVYKTRVLGRNIAVFLGAEGNRFVLQTGAKYFEWKSGWPPTFVELLGESLFVQDGDEHRQKRKLIMPAFHRQALHNFFETMQDISLQYLHKWGKNGRLPVVGAK